MTLVGERPPRNGSNFEPLAWRTCNAHRIIKRIEQAGIIGLGGAGYPTHRKLAQLAAQAEITLIANGIECDPGVSADQTLLQEYAADVVEGLRIVAHCTRATKTVVAVREAKSRRALEPYVLPEIEVAMQNVEPGDGEERQLIRRLLQLQIPEGCYPTTYGVGVFNVATLFAVCEAVRDGYRLDQRLITAFGHDRWINRDAQIREMEHAPVAVRLGGPGTGIAATASTPIPLTVNAVCEDFSPQTLACIRCGWCSDSCPRGLPVQAMFHAAASGCATSLETDRFEDCNECGACVVRCPSAIPLLDYIRAAQSEIRSAHDNARVAAISAARFDRRNQRLRSRVQQEQAKRQDRLRTPRTW